MDSLETYIKKLGPYFKSMERFNDAIIVRVVFPQTWKTYDNIDGTIKNAKSEEHVGEYFYYGDSNEVSYGDIFSLVLDTVEKNESTLKKLDLLKAKVNQLKELFADPSVSYESLEKLEFKMPKKKIGRQKKIKEGETKDE